MGFRCLRNLVVQSRDPLQQGAQQSCDHLHHHPFRLDHGSIPNRGHGLTDPLQAPLRELWMPAPMLAEELPPFCPPPAFQLPPPPPTPQQLPPHRHRDRTAPEAATQFPPPGLHHFGLVLQFSAFPLRRICRLQAPHVLLIGPVDAYERHKLRLPDFFPGCHSSSSSSCLCTSCRGWLCFGETLIVEPSWLPCSRLHLSIRFGRKSRPAVRDSDLKHRVFGHKTRNRRTPLTAPILGSQQKTSSATIRTGCAALSLQKSGRNSTMPGFCIADAGEGLPFPCTPSPKTQICTDLTRRHCCANPIS